jgi:1,4-alpha-glucan branching enzyme
MALKIFETDPMLAGVQGQIWDRVNGYKWWLNELETNEGGLAKFAEGYKIYGWIKEDNGYTYREWLPAAKQVFLIGEFNGWENTHPLKPEGFGRWALHLPNKPDGSPFLPHTCQIKVRIESGDGSWHDRVPAWAKLAWQDSATNLFNGVFWEPPAEKAYGSFKHPRPPAPANLKIYEAHVGMASFEPKVATYTEFADVVLPRIARLGYNAVQLMACAEHAHYGCFGYHVTSFFAPASRQGTPEELKYLVDTAHGLGIIVLMDLVHAHASSNTLDGLAMMDGTDHCYTHGGAKGHHAEWDSKIFHVTKYEVMRFLLSNIRWWLEEYKFDGFRFDGITSMLYHSHGIGKGYTGGYHEYFGPDADIDTHVYLMLANHLIHEIVPTAITVGEDVSGMPTLCRPVEDGGFGFDYRLAMAIPDMFIKLLKEGTDDAWDMGWITHTLTNRRYMEKVVAYCESHDQAIVGDKTLAFWLMDAEMYTGMSLFTQPQPSMVVDRGLALHKMIRLLVLGLGGEAYLAFMGNEFGHPEWVDFPRPENGWSHAHCRRRWDLADDELLRYKFFQEFDVLMNACENRFQWLTSDYQYVTVKSQEDKVIAFDRGDCLFVFNFHPCQSFEGYGIGTKWGEPMRCVLDTDEGRFGGHHRLDYGHSNTFPQQSGSHERPHSVKMYLPARTGQVLVPESRLQGGTKIWLSKRFMAGHGITSCDQVILVLEAESKNKDGEKDYMEFQFKDNCVVLGLNFGATFSLVGPGNQQLDNIASKDGIFKIHFPGDYTIEGLGYVRVGTLSATAKADQVVQIAADAAPQATAGSTAPVARSPEVSQAPAPAAPKVEAKPYQAEKPVEAPKVDSPPAGLGRQTSIRAEERKEPDPVMQMPTEQGPSRSQIDMARCYSGSHLISMEELDAEPTGPGKESTPQDRVMGFQSAVSGLGNSLTDFANSYKTFGLHEAGGELTFREWVPNAAKVYIVGEFNSWDKTGCPLTEDPQSPGVWFGKVRGVTKGSKYKLYVEQAEGEPYWPLPAWCTRYVYTPETKLLDAVYWPLTGAAPKPLTKASDGSEKIYECHPGIVARPDKATGFAETMMMLLPRIKRNGYTALLLMGVLECKEFASMGAQPVSLFAPAHKLGTPDEMRSLVSKAHELGLRVLLSIAHNGAAAAEDGLGAQYFVPGAVGFHPITGARLYDFTQKEVCRYLLSSLSYWTQEYGVDGFRFQDVSSSIYTDHGMFVPEEAEELAEYLAREEKLNGAGIQYQMMANDLVRTLNRTATIIADEYTLYPGVCESVANGGLGFDIRQHSNAPSLFRNNLSGKRDEEWCMGDIVNALSTPKAALPNERLIGYTEIAEHCAVAQRPLKIAMLSWETLHTIAAGGVAPHVTELAGALHAQGHEVHIFTRTTNGTTWEHKVWGVIYHEVDFQTNSDFVREIENMCQAFVGNFCQVDGSVHFDIVHGHDWLVGPAISAIASMGKKTVFTMHSTETGRCGNMQYAGQSARIRSIEGHACHAAGRLIAVSGVLKEEVCNHYGVDGRKIEVIYNGIHADSIINMEWQDDWTGNTKRDKGFDVMDPMFLFVGRLAVQKGPDLLLQAIPDILRCRGDAKFVFVGDGHMKSDLEAKAGSMGIGHAVHFAGSVKSGTAHLKSLFKSCDAVVVPSRNEPFGIVVLEAWAAGKPVVATTCGGPRDFVKPDQDGYLVNPDPGSISWGCCKILENFEHSRWMGQRAQKKAVDEFNWSFIARQTEAIYFEQLGTMGAARVRVKGGCYLAAPLLGQVKDQMGVMEQNVIVHRGLAMLKQMKLAASSLGNDATMTWMGTEIGQIDSVDMPRITNGHADFKLAFGQADDKGKKFKHLEFFELCLNRTEAVLKYLQAPAHTILVQDEEAKVLIYARGGCVFAFNFHPEKSHGAYPVTVSAKAQLGPEIVQVLNSEDKRFGGVEVAKAGAKLSTSALKLAMPPRSAVIYAPAASAAALAGDKLLSADADSLIGA